MSAAHEPGPSLLADRDLTAEERAAHDEDPRPGVCAGESGADLHKLTQEETDALIRADLCMVAAAGDRDEVAKVCGLTEGSVSDGRQIRPVMTDAGDKRIAWYQRGGIDSDPLVRLLAYRAWGDRDRQWFVLRGVRAGDQVHVLAVRHSCGREEEWRSELTVAKARRNEWVAGIALADAAPGALAICDIAYGRLTEAMRRGLELTATLTGRGVGRVQCRVSDRLRADPWQPRETPSDRHRRASALLRAAEQHFIAQGIDHDSTWTEHVAGAASRLMCAPSGRASAPELHLVLARTWVEAGELRYEGPEVRDRALEAAAHVPLDVESI